ncbi:DUF2809 domain-containing protein [Agrobacterium tumefaciens]|nr:DUF2809 domain-containing protein [Agrobacterium tumefaciens]
MLILSGLILVILAGLALRRYGYTIGLPFLIVKYGGSVLWGGMVYLLAALLFVNRRTQLFIIAATCCFAIAVELLRLVHFPALDTFRDTATGTLLLGRVFSPWNILCYFAGIGMAAAITLQVARR